MDYYQRYLADYPDSPRWKDVLWELGNLYEAQGQLDVARGLYRAIWTGQGLMIAGVS